MASAPARLSRSIHPLARGLPPAWAEEWGQDELGGWVALRVGKATQRMRWVTPGRFLMGSPETEAERFSDEGPRHEVRFESGFWMFDTPCTQAFWTAVMGENPSRFQGPDHPDHHERPVESVSWDECQTFVSRLNEQIESLALGLPSESQWEYACRAGTEGARYGEDLDAIAWCRENSGGQTHPVGDKLPNAWGLYDMLGNVWEWCQTPWTSDYAPGREPSAQRVVRGGSWLNGARGVRAAFRRVNDPAYRNGSLGFRCAEFRQGS